MPTRFYVETLGCPKNQVDSEKIVGTLLAEGMVAADDAATADLVVVNTSAFIDAARQESVDTVLALSDARKHGARLVVTGCMAERYGEELAEAMPEADLVAGFGVPVSLTLKAGRRPVPTLDLLNLPRPKSAVPWAYVKIAEGCDRSCGFCAIPSFRGPQRSRTPEAILQEVDALEVAEIVLVAQDLASYGKDEPGLGAGAIVPLVRAVSERVAAPAAVPVSVRPHRRPHRRHLRHGRSLLRPVVATRVEAPAAAHAALGRRRPLPAPHGRHPPP